MLYNYQTEIMGVVAILVISVIYLVIKIKKEKKTQEDTYAIEKEKIPEVAVKEQEEEKVEEIPHTQHHTPELVLDGKEEGSFGEEEKQEEIKEKETEENTHVLFQKRDVPPHDKITKEHFKEFAGTRILVAEDNLINQKVINGLLADSGIEVVIADDGQITLDILEEDTNFTLILMDAHMPRVDGFEATRIIRSNPKYNHIVVVALSGDTAADDIKKMSEAGMSEHLEKPLRMNDLYDIIYAYSGSQKTPEQETSAIMTQELDGEKGLEICGGDEEFYQEILSEFVATYQDSTQKLLQLLEKGDLKEADKILLDIIGITANIGADPLNKITTDIKLSLSDTQEKSYLELLEEYKIHIQALIQDIKNYKSS